MSVFNINDLLSENLVTGLANFEKSLESVSKAVGKMAEGVELSLDKTGKAYAENKENLEKLLQLYESQKGVDKELLKIQKQKQKELDKTEQQQKELAEATQTLVKSTIALNQAKQKGENIEKGYLQVIEAQKKVVSDTAKAHGKLSDEYADEKIKLSQIQKEQKEFNKQQRDVAKFAGVADDSLAKLSKELGELKAQYRNASAEGRKQLLPQIQKLDKEVKGLDANIGNFQRNVGNYGSAFNKLAGFAGGLGLAIGGLEVAKGVANQFSDLNKISKEVQATFGATADEATKLTATINSLATTYGVDSQEILKSTNAISKEFALGTTESLDLVKEAIERNLDIATIQEYSAQFDSAGVNAETFLSILDTSQKQGIFSDKGADAIKEGLLRLRELTPATKDALLAIGFTNDEITKGIEDGTLASFEGIQEVSERLNSFKDNAPQVGLALADIFGGAGEDAGIRYIKMLADVDTNLQNSAKTSTSLQEAQQQLTESFNNLLFSTDLQSSEYGNMIGAVTDLLTKTMDIATETNFLGKQFKTVLSPILDLFSTFKALSEIFAIFKGNTDEAGEGIGAFSMVVDVLTTTTKLATLPLTAITKLLKFFSELLRDAFERNADKVAQFREIFNSLKDVFNAVKSSVIQLYDNAIKPLISGFGDGIDSVNLLGMAMDGLIWYFKTASNNLINLLDLLKIIDKDQIERDRMLAEQAENQAETRANLFNAISSSHAGMANNIENQNIEIQNSENAVTQNLEDNAKKREQIRDQLSLTTSKEYYDRELADLQNYLNEGIISETEFLDLRKSLQEKYFGDFEKLQTENAETFFEIQDGANAEILASTRNFGNQFLEENKKTFGDWVDNFIGDEDEFKEALKEFYNVAINEAGRFLETQLNVSKELEGQREKNIESLQSELDRELEIQTLRQEAGEAYDLGRIESLQASIAEEQRLKDEQAAKTVALEKKLILFQLGVDTASAISSLLVASEGNPLNLFTGGAAGIAQFATGLIRIFASIATAKAQLAKLGDGGLIDFGKSHADGGTPIEAERGEFVMRKSAVQALGVEKMKLINQGIIPTESENNILDLERNALLKKMTAKKQPNKVNYIKTIRKVGKI
jgi:hypothetical protein